jgi:hypothetical protein
VWSKGTLAKIAILIKSGIFEYFDCAEARDACELTTGIFIGETPAILESLRGEKSEKGKNEYVTSIRCASQKGSVFVIKRRDLASFLSNNPGLRLIFCEKNCFGNE